MGEGQSRRDFLRLAGGAAVVAAAGSACGSGPKKAADAEATKAEPRTLRIFQFTHFVPGYDQWFDEEYTKQWGQAHDVRVIVDHVPGPDIYTRAEAEESAQRGHDIFGLVSPPGLFEDAVIDHREIVDEVEAKVGKMAPAIDRAIRNRRTGKYFAFAGFWAALPVHYRVDLWETVAHGIDPGTWDGIAEAAARLKGANAPVGVGLSAGIDSTLNAFALLFSHGGSLQDETGRVVLDSPATVRAVQTATAIYRAGMTDEVLTWDDASDNRFLASGKGSLTLDPISALRAIEKQDPLLAEKIGLRAPPAGPKAQISPALVHSYLIWKFSPNQELAKQFLVDLALASRESLVRSEFYNLPPFPGSVPDLAEIVARDPVARPTGKYSVLADAPAWTTNLGYPGDTNPAVADVFNQFIVPRMFVAAARDGVSPQEAVKAATAEAAPIFDKWRERGKI